MNRIIRLPILLILLQLLSCRNSTISTNAILQFNNTEHNFRDLELNESANCAFKFSNPGTTPLVVYYVKTSCGCTVPEWTKEPVKPGKSGEIQIIYDTSQSGFFNKTITVFYNGKDSPQNLTIKGRVGFSVDGD